MLAAAARIAASEFGSEGLPAARSNAFGLDGLG